MATTIRLPSLEKIINEAFIPLWYNQDRFLLLWGGRGSSKSNFAAKKKIYECLTFPYFRDILIRDTYNSIKDSQYQTIKDIIYEWGLQSLFRFTTHPLEIHCVNGNSFLARGCDDVDKIKSIKDPTGAWYEEGNMIKQEDFLTITTSIRTSKAKFLQEIFSFNPECETEPEEFWIYKMFFAGKEDLGKSFRSELTIEHDKKLLTTPYTVHHSTYKDNKWIGDEFIAFLEQMKNTDPYYYDVYCLGLWGQRKVTNPFAAQYDPAKHEAIVLYDKNKTVYVSLDFNLVPMAATYWHIWEDENGHHCHCFDEETIDQANVLKWCDVYKSKYPEAIPMMKLTGDAMGKQKNITERDNSSNYELIRRELRIRESQIELHGNPTHSNSRTDVNNVLFNHPDFKINPVACPNTCRDMKTVECDAYNSIIKKNRKDLSQRADHIDTVRYLINTFMRVWIKRNQRI